MTDVLGKRLQLARHARNFLPVISDAARTRTRALSRARTVTHTPNAMIKNSICAGDPGKVRVLPYQVSSSARKRKPGVVREAEIEGGGTLPFLRHKGT